MATLRLASLTAGGGGIFIESPTVAAPDARVELPVDYRGNVTYDAGNWSATASTMRSMRYVASGRPAPRYAPTGVLFV